LRGRLLMSGRSTPKISQGRHTTGNITANTRNIIGRNKEINTKNTHGSLKPINQ